MRAWIGLTLGLASLAGSAACGTSVASPGGGGTGPGGSGGGGTTSSSVSSTSTSTSSSSTSTSSSSTSTSSSSSSSGSAKPECTDDSQCVLVNDCCNCVGIPATQPPPPCGAVECFVTTCDAIGQSKAKATCAAGQCVAGLACDHNQVACASPPPSCPPGQTASVSGLCWGGCVPATECATVGSCAQCGKDQACVKEVTQIGLFIHCVAAPPSCNGTPSCACMGSAACVPPFGACIDEAPGVFACECPNC